MKASRIQKLSKEDCKYAPLMFVMHPVRKFACIYACALSRIVSHENQSLTIARAELSVFMLRVHVSLKWKHEINIYTWTGRIMQLGQIILFFYIINSSPSNHVTVYSFLANLLFKLIKIDYLYYSDIYRSFCKFSDLIN